MALHPGTDILLQQIGEKLYKIRHSRKEKITSVAKSIQVSHSVLSQIENGKYKSLNIDMLSKIAAYYKIEINDLLPNTASHTPAITSLLLK